jgi:hypothetical protein
MAEEIETHVPHAIMHGSFESQPVRFTPMEAWMLHDNGTWQKWSAPGEIAVNAKVMSEDDFHAAFGKVPPLPPSAFRSKP